MTSKGRKTCVAHHELRWANRMVENSLTHVRRVRVLARGVKFVAKDRPYESFGDIDGWSGPTKADIRSQKQHDQIAQAAQATADRLLASGYRPSYAALVHTEALLRRLQEYPPPELMHWRLRLFCGHMVDLAAHPEHKTIQAAFTSARDCPECGAVSQVIVAALPLGIRANPRAKATRPIPTPRVKSEVEQLREENARLREDLARLRVELPG